MLSTDLGACEWFVWDLRRSNLIDRGQLDQHVGEFLSQHPGAEPPALAEFLVGRKILTQFQAERLLQGKTQGFVLGPFILLDSLGSGSMGTVYKAESKNDKGCYAVKVLPRRSMWNVRIARRKVRAFEQCKHPAVVPFVDVGTAGGMHYLAWPLVEGESLDRAVSRTGKLSPAATARLGIEAAEGLAGCHAQGLFHGLLKPSNLMLTADGSVRILDLGIGCLLAETEGESLVDTMSTANSVSSGLDCASPESIMDPTNLTPAGDQYSLGCILYYCLTGQFPFPDGTAVEKMTAHQIKQPTPISQLRPEAPAGLIAVVERLMQKTPEARFTDAAAVVEALRPFAERASSSPFAARTHTAAAPDSKARRLTARPTPLDETPHPAPRSVAGERPNPVLPSRRTLTGNGASPARSATLDHASPVLPTRRSLQGHAAPVGPVSAARKVPAPIKEPAQSATPVAEAGPAKTQDRFGTWGLAACAVLACLLAWLVSRSFFRF